MKIKIYKYYKTLNKIWKTRDRCTPSISSNTICPLHFNRVFQVVLALLLIFCRRSYSRSAGVSHRENTNAYIVISICSQSRKFLPRLIFGTTNPSQDLPVLLFRALIIRKCQTRME